MKPDKAPRLDQWATATEVAETLGLSRESANRMIHNGDFKTLHVLPGARDQYLVKKTELAQVAEEREGQRASVRKAYIEREVPDPEPASS